MNVNTLRTKIVLLAFALLLLGAMPAQAQKKWHTIEQADKADIGDRLYLIDFYTDWCGYCKKMDRETFSDATVKLIIEKYYYPVKFNAEGKNTVTWKGKTYNPVTSGRNRTHEFARGLQGYPTTAVLKADGTTLCLLPGFYKADDFVVALWYFASGDYNHYSFEQYSKIFDKEIRPKMLKELKK